MTSQNMFKLLKLVDEQELIRLVEKQLRDYNPTINAMAALKREMDSTFSREDLSAEEKIGLLKAAQQRFNQLSSALSNKATEPGPSVAGAAEPSRSAVEERASPFAEANELPFQEHPVIDSQATPGMAQPDETQHDATEPEGQSSKFRKIDKRAFPIVPEKHTGRLALLSELILKSPSLIDYVPDSGELKLNGVAVPGSSFREILHSFYEKPEKGKVLPGQKELVELISKNLKPGGAWGDQNLKLLTLIPRHSLHPMFDSSRAKESEEEPGAQAGKGRINVNRRLLASIPSKSSAHPPGTGIKILRLY